MKKRRSSSSKKRRSSSSVGSLLSVGSLIILVIMAIFFQLSNDEAQPAANPTSSDDSPILGGAPGPTTPSTTGDHLTLGNPSAAVADARQPNNYLIVRDQYALSYSRDRGIPNWVSWHLARADLGDVDRYSGQFITDVTLPDGWYRVTHRDYSNSGYDRGHLTPSADRTATVADNEATFILTNVMPQAPENNQGLWSDLEEFTRDLVREGNEVYVIAGSTGTREQLAGGALTVPEFVWKVLLAIPEGRDDLNRISGSAELIAIWTPNSAEVAGKSWRDYQVDVACIEQRTGLDLLDALPDDVELLLSGAGCDGVAASAPNNSGQLAASFRDCADDPNAARAPDAPVAIVDIDKAAETVTLQNVGRTNINLDNWIMCSVRGTQQHPIGGSLAPGAEAVFPSDGNIWSNSESDPGALYSPDGVLVSYWPD